MIHTRCTEWKNMWYFHTLYTQHKIELEEIVILMDGERIGSRITGLQQN